VYYFPAGSPSAVQLVWIPSSEYLFAVGLDIALALGLGLLIAVTYARAYRTIVQSSSFVHTCAIMVLLVALLVKTIRISGSDSSALAFALVGLVGLIRFRTVVRDTREFSFVFLCIVVGVLIGAGHQAIGAGICALVLSVLVILDRIGFGGSITLAMRVNVTGNCSALQAYVDALLYVASRVDLISLKSRTDGNATYSFEIVALPGRNISEVIFALRTVKDSTDISIWRLQRGKSGALEDD
jgi:hypothetical protein